MSQQQEMIPRQALVPVWTMGDRLRKAREIANIGVAEMAERLDRQRKAVSRYERSRIVDQLVLRAYAQETGVSYTWLATGMEPHGGEPRSDRVTLGELGIGGCDLAGCGGVKICYHDHGEQLTLEFAA